MVWRAAAPARQARSRNDIHEDQRCAACATRFRRTARTSRVRDRGVDSLHLQPVLQRRHKTADEGRTSRSAFDGATMQRHFPDQEPDRYDEAHYRARYRDAPYYSTGRSWRDYAPAYRYGHVARHEHPHERFEQVEPQLAREWLRCRADSRLQWVEARGAVRDAWRHHDEAGCDAADRGH